MWNHSCTRWLRRQTSTSTSAIEGTWLEIWLCISTSTVLSSTHWHVFLVCYPSDSPDCWIDSLEACQLLCVRYVWECCSFSHNRNHHTHECTLPRWAEFDVRLTCNRLATVACLWLTSLMNTPWWTISTLVCLRRWHYFRPTQDSVDLTSECTLLNNAGFALSSTYDSTNAIVETRITLSKNNRLWTSPSDICTAASIAALLR